MKDFGWSFFVTAVCLALAGYWGHVSGMGIGPAVLLAAVLGVMEVSLSFDNAVVNAGVLKTMDAYWQRLFLTVGILIAVFGMRLVFPIVIVGVATGLSLPDVTMLALQNPTEYSRHLHDAYPSIAAFGGMFLLLVFLSFLIDEGKDVHWIGPVEARLAKLGKLDSAPVLVALLVLVLVHFYMPVADDIKLSVLAAGISGVVLFIVVSSLDALFESDSDESEGQESGSVTGAVARNGLAGFIYLEVLDASFSFDGVIGAFAVTRDVVIIMLGLAIGAMFVRSLTVHLVRKGTLDQYVFLEHGAHYGIGALAIIMIVGIVNHVSEVVTGVIGVAFIALSVVSSMIHNRKSAAG